MDPTEAIIGVTDTTHRITRSFRNFTDYRLNPDRPATATDQART
jgi:hypothetical protein